MWENGSNVDWGIGDFDGSWCSRRVAFSVSHSEPKFENLPIHEHPI